MSQGNRDKDRDRDREIVTDRRGVKLRGRERKRRKEGGKKG